MNKILMLILSSFVVACSNPLVAHAKSFAPVGIEYSVPKTVEIGEEVTTVIRFVVRADLQRLVLSVSPYSGLELIASGDNVEFADLQKADAREMAVNIRLTDEVGYLSIFATTTDLRGKTQTRSIAIRYGAAGEATIQKMRTPGSIDNSKDERLILMPGSPR